MKADKYERIFDEELDVLKDNVEVKIFEKKLDKQVFRDGLLCMKDFGRYSASYRHVNYTRQRIWKLYDTKSCRIIYAE